MSVHVPGNASTASLKEPSAIVLPSLLREPSSYKCVPDADQPPTMITGAAAVLASLATSRLPRRQYKAATERATARTAAPQFCDSTMMQPRLVPTRNTTKFVSSKFYCY